MNLPEFLLYKCSFHFQIDEKYLSTLQGNIDKLVRHVEEALLTEVDHGDHSIYTGITGRVKREKCKNNKIVR